jgi:hypothetical protein
MIFLSVHITTAVRDEAPSVLLCDMLNFSPPTYWLQIMPLLVDMYEGVGGNISWEGF